MRTRSYAGAQIGMAVLAVAMMVLALPSIGSAAGNRPGIMPGLSASPDTFVNGVSCTSALFCVAVGASGPFGAIRTLVEEWDGTGWRVVTSPNTDGTQSELSSVSCLSPTFCMAVGNGNIPGENPQTLAETWNGAVWSIVNTPSPGGDESVLSGVSCVSVTFCVAAGDYINATVNTLADQWNGATWSIVSSPNPGGFENYLDSVSCIGTNFCVATGTFGSGGSTESLIEQWDGASWSAIDSPNPTGSQTDELSSASCASVDLCIATGYSSDGSPSEQTLIEKWDGSAWSLVVSPNTSSPDNYLFGVSCANSSSCTAVGDYGGASDQTLIEQWSGTNWAIVPSPNFANGSTTVLSGVDCISISFCIAAGDAGGQPPALIENWTGVSWQISPTTFEDDGINVSFDGWHTLVDPTADGGTYQASSSKGATATFKFSGTGITWVTHKGPASGIASVTIDGVKKSNLDLYAASPETFSQGYSGLASKAHTIVITVTGTRNTAASNTYVNFDAFIVGFTTTQDSSSNVTYDAWKGATSTSASGGTYRSDGKAKATSTLTFTGTGVTWVTATSPSAGKATVTIDGVNKGTVDLYTPTVHWQVAESYIGLSFGPHTTVVRVLGTKNTASVGTQVVVDAFVVQA